MAISAADTVLAVVPMFHANAWGLAFACPMAGAKMVLPGPRLDGASVFNLMDAEGVTMSAGVPTVWMMLIETMRALGATIVDPADFPDFEELIEKSQENLVLNTDFKVGCCSSDDLAMFG